MMSLVYLLVLVQKFMYEQLLKLALSNLKIKACLHAECALVFTQTHQNLQTSTKEAII